MSSQRALSSALLVLSYKGAVIHVGTQQSTTLVPFPKPEPQRDKFGDQLPNGGAHRFCITWETSDRAPVNESTETSLSLIHVFSVSLGPANYGFKIPNTYERAPGGQPNREAPSNFELAGPSPVQTMVKRSR